MRRQAMEAPSPAAPASSAATETEAADEPGAAVAAVAGPAAGDAEQHGVVAASESARLQRLTSIERGEGYRDGWNWFGAGFSPMRRQAMEAPSPAARASSAATETEAADKAGAAVAAAAGPAAGDAEQHGEVAASESARLQRLTSIERGEGEAHSPAAPASAADTETEVEMSGARDAILPALLTISPPSPPAVGLPAGWGWFGATASPFALQSLSELGALAPIVSHKAVGVPGSNVPPPPGPAGTPAGFRCGWNWFGAGFAGLGRPPLAPTGPHPRASDPTPGAAPGVGGSAAFGYAFLLATAIHAAALQASHVAPPLPATVPLPTCSVAVQTCDSPTPPPTSSPPAEREEALLSVGPRRDSPGPVTGAPQPPDAVPSNSTASSKTALSSHLPSSASFFPTAEPTTSQPDPAQADIQSPAHPTRIQAEGDALPRCLAPAPALSPACPAPPVHDPRLCPFTPGPTPAPDLATLADAELRGRQRLVLTWRNRLRQHEEAFLQDLRAARQQPTRRVAARPGGESPQPRPASPPAATCPPSEPPGSTTGPGAAGLYWLQRGECECRTQILHSEALHWQALEEWESRPQPSFPYTPTKRHHRCQPAWLEGSPTFDRISLGVEMLPGQYVALQRAPKGGACAGLCSRVPCGRHTYAWTVELCTDCPYLELGFAAGNMLRDGRLNGKCAAGVLFRLIDGRVAVLNKGRVKHVPLPGSVLYRRGTTLTLTLDAARRELALACGGRPLGPVYRCAKGPFPYPLFPAFHCALHTEQYIFRVDWA
eukprot:EG_transcript_2896